MSCCGGKRREAAVRTVGETEAPSKPALIEPAPVMFEYTGATGMRVRGQATGKLYRFANSGAQVAVDSRDAASLRAVPKLRPVKRTDARL